MGFGICDLWFLNVKISAVAQFYDCEQILALAICEQEFYNFNTFFFGKMLCCKKRNEVDPKDQYVQVNGSWVSKATLKDNKDPEDYPPQKQDNKHNQDENVQNK